MLKENKKDLLLLLICIIIIATSVWIQNFGLPPKYDSGKTIEQALNVGYGKNPNSTGLSQILSIVDLPKDEKLVFYQSKKNTLSCGLIKKTWHNTWNVLRRSGEYPLDESVSAQDNQDKELAWIWTNMNEFGLTLGVVNDANIDKIMVGENKAVILNTPIQKKMWFFTDKTTSASGGYDVNLNIKAFNKDNLLYSYFPLN